MEHEPPWHNAVAAFLADHAPGVAADELTRRSTSAPCCGNGGCRTESSCY